MDLVFATCDKHKPSTGLGENCKVNVAFNQQAGLCSTKSSQYAPGGRLVCRGYDELCSSDPHFEFNFWENSDVGQRESAMLIGRPTSLCPLISCSPTNTFSFY